MITKIAVVAIILATLAVMYICFSSRRSRLLEQVRQELQRARTTLLARDRAATQEFVDTLDQGGRSVEQALPEY